jgi:hypothetical protein
VLKTPDELNFLMKLAGMETTIKECGLKTYMRKVQGDRKLFGLNQQRKTPSCLNGPQFHPNSL